MPFRIYPKRCLVAILSCLVSILFILSFTEIDFKSRTIFLGPVCAENEPRTKQYVPAPEHDLVSFLAKLDNFQNDVRKELQTTEGKGDNKSKDESLERLKKRLKIFLDESQGFLQKFKRGNSPVHLQSSIDENNFTCPEIYKGSTYGYPFFRKGFQTTNCTKKPINESVSIFVIKTGSAGAPSLKKAISARYPGIKVYHTDLELKESGRSFGSLLKYVKTKFVLLLPNLAFFDANIDIERLLRVLTMGKPPVVAVGGAVKDPKTGHWNNACLQTSLSNYIFRKKLGYYTSFNECLVCDSLAGPFLTRRDFLLELPFEDLQVGMFEDWFWRIKLRNNGLENSFNVLSCPDVMFTQHSTIKNVELKPFADKWDIKKIIEADNSIRWYGCRDGVRKSDVECAWRKGMTVPPCCLANLADAITFFMKTCSNFNITCELQEGTHLGALKFGYVLPWERDADLTFLTSDFHKLKSLENEFRDEGYILGEESEPWCCADGIKAGGVFKIRAGSWYLEVYGQHIMDSSESRKKGKMPTLLKFADSWVQVPDNPGQFARNRYGREIYRHAEHWITTSHGSGWDLYYAGKFTSCSRPGHHGCLDRFQADGNMQFKGYL